MATGSQTGLGVSGIRDYVGEQTSMGSRSTKEQKPGDRSELNLERTQVEGGTQLQMLATRNKFDDAGSLGTSPHGPGLRSCRLSSRLLASSGFVPKAQRHEHLF
jgi:hypothetical protein